MPFTNHSGYRVDDLVIGDINLFCPPKADQFKSASFRIQYFGNDGPQDLLIPDMMTDLASVPRLLWPAYPPHRRIKRAAVAHDGLYQFRPILSSGIRITRGEADMVLYAACILENMSREEAEQIYLGVRVGGSNVWHAHDKEFA